MTALGWPASRPAWSGAPLGLLLVPSLGTTSGLFDELADALSARLPDAVVERVDLPGHGTGPSATEVSIEGLADEIADRVGDSRPDELVIVGVSMGGAIALEVARRHPGLVDGFVQINSSVRFGDEAGWEALTSVVRREGTTALAESSRLGWFSRDFSTSAAAEKLLGDLSRIDDATYIACCDALSRYRGGHELSAISARALLIGTADDQATPAGAMREVAGQLADADFHLLAAGGHLSVVQHAVGISRTITDWRDAGARR